MLNERIKYLASALYEYCKNGRYESDGCISSIVNCFQGIADFRDREFVDTFRINFSSGTSLTLIIEGKREEDEHYSLRECEIAIKHAFYCMGFKEEVK